MDGAGGRAAWRRRTPPDALGNEPAVWVGDEARRSDDCIRTSVEHNPRGRCRIGATTTRRATAVQRALHAGCLRFETSGVADRMRWKIFHDHVGFAVDVDGSCTDRSDDWLLEHVAFACWKTVGPMPRRWPTAAADCTGNDAATSDPSSRSTPASGRTRLRPGPCGSTRAARGAPTTRCTRQRRMTHPAVVAPPMSGAGSSASAPTELGGASAFERMVRTLLRAERRRSCAPWSAGARRGRPPWPQPLVLALHAGRRARANTPLGISGRHLVLQSHFAAGAVVQAQPACPRRVGNCLT